MGFTEEQNKILDKNKHGLFVIKAAPGSGKTFTITKKAMDIIDNWNYTGGLALLSFTNIAVNGMKETFKIFDNSFEIQHPHFIGTLDSFINNYIFLPFGHLEMKCKCRPQLVGKPFNTWVGKFYAQQQFTEITRDLNGNWVKVPGSKLESNWESKPQILSEKKKLIKLGYANRADAHYYALKILKNHENILKLLVKRFPYIILDEAQDTSEIQMEILNTLVNHGLSNLILVGDPEQAIYEWNDANPMLFENKFQEWKSDSIKLKENFRCSSSICDFISKFSHSNFISKNNENLLEIKPSLKTYSNEDTDIKNIIAEFKQYCDSKNIPKDYESRAILFRGKPFANKFRMGAHQFNIYSIFPGFDLEHTFTRYIVLGKYLWDLEFKREGFELLEKAYIMLEEKIDFVTHERLNLTIEKKGLIKHRKDILEFIGTIPTVNTNDDMNKWINNINNNFKWEIRLKKRKNNLDSNFEGKFKEIQLDLDKSSNDCHFGTIHSVKGKSFRAVLLILKEKSGNGKKYSKMFEKYDLLKEEELRIPYVAMTRAKEILWIAIPNQEKRFWEMKVTTNPPPRSIQQTLF